jgi:hypothetical protein
MYSEDKWIDGVLWHRTTPDGKWYQVNEQGLTARLLNEQMKTEALLVRLRVYEEVTV